MAKSSKMLQVLNCCVYQSQQFFKLYGHSKPEFALSPEGAKAFLVLFLDRL